MTKESNIQLKMFYLMIKELLISLIRSKDSKFTGLKLKEQRDVEDLIDEYSQKIASEFYANLVKEGFPEKEISEIRQKELLHKTINRYMSNVNKQPHQD